jgi:osmotically-inducible protein OsmY
MENALGQSHRKEERIAMKFGLLGLCFLFVAACSKSGAAVTPDATTESVAAVPKTPGSGGPAEPVEDPMDLVISDNVRDALLREKGIGTDAGAIVVTSHNAIVTLRGFVRTDALKQRVTIVVKAVGSVARVENELVVDPEAVKTHQKMESTVDRQVSSRVRQALLDDRAIAPEASAVSILTQDGVVQLTGTVSSEAIKARVDVVAKAVGSVKRVVNELQVKGR